MPIFFWKREKEIEQLMDNYMKEALSCLDIFKDCLFALFENSTSETAINLVLQVDQAESRSDHLRHQIELALYDKALMPESRGDLLEVVEALDRIPNWAEEVAYDIQLQRIVFPAHLIEQFQHLVAMNVQCFHLLYDAATALFTDLESVFRLTREVDALEGKIDEVERELIHSVFDIEERLSYQHLLYRTIRSICNISDKTENVADRLAIMAAKRRI